MCEFTDCGVIVGTEQREVSSPSVLCATICSVVCGALPSLTFSIDACPQTISAQETELDLLKLQLEDVQFQLKQSQQKLNSKKEVFRVSVIHSSLTILPHRSNVSW